MLTDNEISDLIERLESHMGRQGVPVLLKDCRLAAKALRALTAAEQAEPAPAADEEEIAKLIWERFAPAHEVEWPSGNAGEYRKVAKDIVGKFQP